MLPAPYRLRHNRDISRVRQEGQRWYHALAALHVRASQQEVSRFAFVASRQVGNAVQRNRAKRLLREATRTYLPHIAPGWDCLIVARSAAAQADYQDVLAAINQLLQRAHLLPPT